MTQRSSPTSSDSATMWAMHALNFKCSDIGGFISSSGTLFELSQLIRSN